MTVEHDSGFQEWPSEPDPIRVAALPLIEIVMEMSSPGSPERARAMSELLAAIERLKRALKPAPRLN
jgi:hypothetical protein